MEKVMQLIGAAFAKATVTNKGFDMPNFIGGVVAGLLATWFF